MVSIHAINISYLTAIPAGGIGTVVGTIISYFLKANPKKVAIVTWVCSILALPPLFGFFVSCPSLDIAGISIPYVNEYVYYVFVAVVVCAQF